MESALIDVKPTGPAWVGHMFITASKAFGVNLLLLLGLHWLPPVAFLVPFITGYVTGWNARASVFEGAVIGAIMAAWMGLLCTLGVLGLVIMSSVWKGGLDSGHSLGIALVTGGLVLHLGIFAGLGAALGGYFGRKDRTASSS